MEKFYKGYNKDRTMFNVFTIASYTIFMLINLITAFGFMSCAFDSPISLLITVLALVTYATVAVDLVGTIARIISPDLNFADMYKNIQAMHRCIRFTLLTLLMSIACNDEAFMILFIINIIITMLLRNTLENRFIDILKKTINEIVKKKSIEKEQETE